MRALAVDCNPDSTRVFNSVVEVELTDLRRVVLLGLLLFPYKIVDFAGECDPTSLSGHAVARAGRRRSFLCRPCRQSSWRRLPREERRMASDFDFITVSR